MKKSIDTNILVYAHQNKDNNLKILAIEVLKMKEITISHFAFCEFLHFLKCKENMNKKEVLKFGNEILSVLPMSFVNRDTYSLAYSFVIRYDFQFKYSIIIADAFLNNCSVLYSRDMQHNQLVEKKLRIVNPFI